MRKNREKTVNSDEIQFGLTENEKKHLKRIKLWKEMSKEMNRDKEII